MNLLAEFIDVSKTKGLSVALHSSFSFVQHNLKHRLRRPDPINKRRRQISTEIDSLFNSTVAYGPLKGLKLNTGSWWGAADRAGMLLGFYELEILELLSAISSEKKYTTFIDVGAADGYYGVGVLVNGLFEHSHCFEMSEKGRQVIAQNAELNHVSQKITVNGIAEKNFYNRLPADVLASSVVLVDIEGAEFDILDADVFRLLKQSIIIIEIHDWVDDGQAKVAKLRSDAAPFFEVTEMTTTARDLSKFAELRDYTDDDRWVICSEGRPNRMTWLLLEPKKQSGLLAA
jgi:hypothetical protein